MTNRARTVPMTTMLVLAALALVLPTAAQADPPAQSGVVERTPVLSSWIFWDGDVIVLTGPPLDDATCIGMATEGFGYEGFLKPVSTVVTPPGSAVVVTTTHADGVWVHDDEGTDDPLGWLFGTCEAILGGAPAPEPLASGEARVTIGNDNVRLTARVTTADGDMVHLNVVGANEGVFPDIINYGG